MRGDKLGFMDKILLTGITFNIFMVTRVLYKENYHHIIKFKNKYLNRD